MGRKFDTQYFCVRDDSGLDYSKVYNAIYILLSDHFVHHNSPQYFLSYICQISHPLFIKQENLWSSGPRRSPSA